MCIPFVQFARASLCMTPAGVACYLLGLSRVPNTTRVPMAEMTKVAVTYDCFPMPRISTFDEISVAVVERIQVTLAEEES